MKISKPVTEVTLSVQDVEMIIKEYLRKNQNIEVNSVRFVIGSHNAPGDWMSQYPPDYLLDEIICTGEKL